MRAETYRVPHPGYKDYVRPWPITWWLRYRNYFLFMVRELSSVFVLLFAVYLVSGVAALARGEAAWNAWTVCVAGSRSLAGVGIVALLFILFHAVTWFLAGAAVSPLRFGDRQVSPRMFVLGNLVLIAAVAAIIGYLSLGG
jgi:fumarate reductase subunit C